MPVKIASIVEGEGDAASLPLLIRRVLSEENANFWADTGRPIRVSRHKLARPGEVERAVRTAAIAVGSRGAILVIVDTDGEPPCELGPEFMKRALDTGLDLPLSVTLAHKEWECWYLGAAKSLAGKRGLKNNLIPPLNPEAVRGAKEWLRSNMIPGRTYSATIDQPRFAAAFSLTEAMICPSFVRFRREVLRIFGEARDRWPD